MQLSEQEVVRREALQKIIEMGINPYPAETFAVNCTSAEVVENFDADENNYQEVQIAGRLMMKRIMGKASFAELQDAHGKFNYTFRAMKFALVKINHYITICLKNC